MAVTSRCISHDAGSAAGGQSEPGVKRPARPQPAARTDGRTDGPSDGQRTDGRTDHHIDRRTGGQAQPDGGRVAREFEKIGWGIS